jgi:hypothetical protein
VKKLEMNAKDIMATACWVVLAGVMVVAALCVVILVAMQYL